VREIRHPDARGLHADPRLGENNNAFPVRGERLNGRVGRAVVHNDDRRRRGFLGRRRVETSGNDVFLVWTKNDRRNTACVGTMAA
jgi:hypothetical protein